MSSSSAGLDHRLVEATSGLDADDEQVQRVRQAVLNLLLALRDSARQVEAGQQVAEHRGKQRDQPSGPRPTTINVSATRTTGVTSVATT